MAKRLSNKNQALLALGATAAIGVFLYTRKKDKVAGIGALSSAESNILKHIDKAIEETKTATYAAIKNKPYDKTLVDELMNKSIISLLTARHYLKNK